HVDATDKALASNKRPERQPGLTATNAAHLVPDAIRKRFIQGWTKHVPLHYLTDAFCSHDNLASAKELNELYTLDGTHGGVVSVPKDLPSAPELDLTFAEWFQAWGRLLELIRTYFRSEFPLWEQHYNRILHRPNKEENWALCVAYDAEVRRRSCTSGLDPSVFHLELWNELESKHIARRALHVVRIEMGKSSGASQSSKSQTPSNSNANSSFRGNPNRLQITGSVAEPQFRCFICGDTDPSHRSRFCNARKLVNGRDAVLVSRKQGEPRTDRNGNNYCYGWNGRSGCDQGAHCSHGKHWCSLCGASDGTHAAQGCPAL
ncbi:hypothetical protein FB451DRAFT_1064480, partial [Mycena latifolia]